MSNKVDKEGSISASESSANLLARVQTAVPSGALFTDTVFNRNTDIPNGSLEIIQVAQLTAALSTFKSASDSDTADTVLQNNIDALEETVEAIPTSQMLVNGSFFNQARFSIANSIQQLNLGLGIWEWLVQPTWSDLQRDNARVLHARMGHLPLEPGADCLCYFPRISGDEDMGPDSLNWVTPTSDTQGTWGVFELATITSAMPNYANSYKIFPNRNVPTAQVSSRGIGWPTAASDAYCVELQVKRDAGSALNITWSPDADTDATDPDFLTALKLRDGGDITFQLDDRRSTNVEVTEADVTQVGIWHHLAIQKPAGGSHVYFYVDGLLLFDSNVTANPPQVMDVLWISGVGTASFRELLVRSSCPYPLTPFTPGPVTFASVIGKGRFNSYMI